MPKYKVGDVAALFPKPSAPKSDTGKKIQSMFDDFYKNSNKRNKPNHAQFGQQKKQVNNEEKFSENPREAKKKKRKHVDDVDSVSNSQDTVQPHIKQKKIKLDPVHQNSNGKATQGEENYFPRNKKKSKHFNSIKENSSAFTEMHFDDGEDESFSQFDSEVQKPSDQKKKKKKKLSQIETAEDNDHEMFKNKSAKKMKKFVNSKNQSEEFSFTDTSAIDEPVDMNQSPEKKSKKKKNKKQKEDKIISNESLTEEIHSDTEDVEAQIKVKRKKSKKMKKSLLAENILSNDSMTEKSLEENEESSEVRPSKKKVQKKPLETSERISRTLFIGNLPVKITRPGLQKLFSPFGLIETCRLRGSVPVKATIPKKVAAIKSDFHAGQKSCIGYVVFKDAKDAAEALTLNGTLVGDHHIVVNPASSSGEKKTYDEKRSIFIGNLPFDVEDEAIWSAFAACGEVEAVRAIRDQETGAGKGFGYVLFKHIDSKEAALKREDIKISDRKIRIKEVQSNTRKSAPSNNNNKLNAMRRKAKKLKGKSDGPNSRKSLKKLMNREKRNYQKKKIANIFKKFST